MNLQFSPIEGPRKARSFDSDSVRSFDYVHSSASSNQAGEDGSNRGTKRRRYASFNDNKDTVSRSGIAIVQAVSQLAVELGKQSSKRLSGKKKMFAEEDSQQSRETMIDERCYLM